MLSRMLGRRPWWGMSAEGGRVGERRREGECRNEIGGRCNHNHHQPYSILVPPGRRGSAGDAAYPQSSSPPCQCPPPASVSSPAVQCSPKEHAHAHAHTATAHTRPPPHAGCNISPPTRDIPDRIALRLRYHTISIFVSPGNIAAVNRTQTRTNALPTYRPHPHPQLALEASDHVLTTLFVLPRGSCALSSSPPRCATPPPPPALSDSAMS
ncbi:hypothetical protein BV20DRAFT_613572 [Pilatotrama ljubarskyi]|nr:hypothetical protein BV20DRAFT_613572 [Pilatotrama ljubarskyi]